MPTAGSMHTSKLNITHLKTASYVLVVILTAFLFVIGIGYRDSAAGRFVVGGIIALGIGLTILFRPQVGGYILITTIITNISTLATVRGFPSINKPLVMLVGISVLLSYLLTQRKRLPKLGSIEWILLLMIGVWVASVPGASFRGPAERKVVDLLKNFIIVISIIYSLRTPRHWKRAIWIAILVTSALAALGVYQAVSGNTAQDFGGLAATSAQEIVEGTIQPRLAGPIQAPNYWALFMVAVLPLVLYRILDEKRIFVKAIASIAAVILVYALLGTYSRGGFVALVAVLIMIVIERRARPSMILFVIILAMLVVALFPANYTERVQSLLVLTPGTSLRTLYEDSSFRGRLAEARAGLRMFAEFPILGVGTGNYKYSYQTYARKLNIETRDEVREAHSLYIETLAETGLVGAAVFALLFGTLLLGLSRVRNEMRKQNRLRNWTSWLASIQISIGTYLVGSVFLHGDYIRYLWILVALGTAGIYLSKTMLGDPQLLASQEGVAT